MPQEIAAADEHPTMAQLKGRLCHFETEEGRLKGLSYQPRPNDIAIVTSPKAGTTWMQQICHQIRAADAGGDLDFDEISRVVPYVELAYDQGQNLEDPQYGDAEGKPRLFKTHQWHPYCPKFPKHIVVLRNPFDVVYSLFKFFEDWFFDAGTLDLDTMANELWLKRGVPENKMQNASYFHHLVSWYERRHDTDILFVFFEDLKEDLEGQVRRVAQYMSTPAHNFDRSDVIQLATQRSTFDYMKSHEDKFDEKLSKLARNEACGLDKMAGMDGKKIVNGQVGLGYSLLSSETREKIEQKWREVVQPVTGCATFEDLRKQMNEFVLTN